MKLNSTKQGYKRAEFKQNNTRPNVYEIIQGSNLNIFDYLEISETKAEHIKSNGAKYILQGFRHEKQVLHTGLIPHPERKAFIGDHKNEKTRKASFMIVIWQGDKITIMYFKNKCMPVGLGLRFAKAYLYF